MMTAALVSASVNAQQKTPRKAFPAAPANPFALRGVPLGIDLESFRALPIPNDPELGRVDPHVVCSGDALAARERLEDYSRSDEGIGVVGCQWFSAYASVTTKSPDQHWVDIGEGSVPPTFLFIPDGDAKRLFAIRTKANSQYYQGVRAAMVANYGAPKVLNEQVQTQGGASLVSANALWNNGASTILLTEHCGRIDRFCLTYEHSRLGKIYDAAVAERTRQAASKI